MENRVDGREALTRQLLAERRRADDSLRRLGDAEQALAAARTRVGELEDAVGRRDEELAATRRDAAEGSKEVSRLEELLRRQQDELRQARQSLRRYRASASERGEKVRKLETELEQILGTLPLRWALRARTVLRRLGLRAPRTSTGAKGDAAEEAGSEDPAGNHPRPGSVNILFSGHDFKFLSPLIRHCRESPGYDVSVVQHPAHAVVDERRTATLARRADLVFCEWCLGNAVWHSRHKRPGQTLVVRLHLQELGLGFVDKVVWDNVDRMVLICPETRDRLLTRLPGLAAKLCVIHNPVDCTRLALPKLAGARFTLGLVGMVPMRKRLDLACRILHKLRAVDGRYTLRVKGRLPHEYSWLRRRAGEMAELERLFQELEGSELKDAVVFDPHGDDMPAWYSKIGFILSTSDFEGSHQAVAEGMASGAVPIIRDWPGAERLYPEEYVWHAVDGAVAMVLEHGGDATFERCAMECRQLAGRFDAPTICAQYDQLFAELRTRPAPRARRPVAVGARSEGSEPALMHLCYLVPGVRNGYRTRVVEQSRHLRELGHRLVLAAFVPRAMAGDEGEQRAFEQELAEETGAEVRLLPSGRFFDLRLGGRAARELVAPLVTLVAAHNVRLVHGHALYAARLALEVRSALPDVRCVFDCHGLAPEETVMTSRRRARVPALEAIERRLLASADLWVLVSERMCEHFRAKYGIEPRRHLVVPSCVHADRFITSAETRERVRLEHRLDGRTVLTYVGSLAAWQWPAALFAVLAQLVRAVPEAHLLLVLPEPDHRAARAALARHRVGPERVSIRELPHHAIGAAIAIADAGFLLREPHPVNQVSSPTKLGEYLASGVPVVATSAVGDLASWLADGKHGLLIEPTDAGLDDARLGDLLGFLRDVRASRDDWRRRCQVLAVDRLSWSRRLRALTAEYRRMVSGPE